MPDALLDLFLGSRCAVCDRPGRVLCPRCRDDLPRQPVTCWPTPRPPGMVPPTAVGAYAGALKRLVNAHKEQHRFALARPLGDLLATAARVHVPDAAGAGGRLPAVVLVPVPSRGSVVRERGHDPLLRVARHAALRLRATGVRAGVSGVLRSVRAVEDQAGLGALARATNLQGSMTCPPARARGLVRDGVRGGVTDEWSGSPLVVVVDDVITTGATLLEAQRALEERGIGVVGSAVVAATRRTSGRPVVHISGGSDKRVRDDSSASLPFWGAGD